MRTAIVTGSNKGIGLQIVKQLLPSVGLMIMACRDPQRGKQAAFEVGAEFEQLDISDDASIDAFAARMTEKYGTIDVLVNNAAIAYKGSDPTPFAEQTGPTLKTNFYGTFRLTEKLLPLLSKSPNGAIVNVASMAGRLNQLSKDHQVLFSAPDLSKDTLLQLVHQYEDDIKENKTPWSSSNYGFSKLAVIAYTKLLARDAPPSLKVNCCCPGYCDTDMTSHKGPRDAAVGAKNAVLLALPDCEYRGVFIQNEQPSDW